MFGLLCFAVIVGLVPLMPGVTPAYNPQEQPAVVGIPVNPRDSAFEHRATADIGAGRPTTAAHPLRICPTSGVSLADSGASDYRETSPLRIHWEKIREHTR